MVSGFSVQAKLYQPDAARRQHREGGYGAGPFSRGGALLPVRSRPAAWADVLRLGAGGVPARSPKQLYTSTAPTQHPSGQQGVEKGRAGLNSKQPPSGPHLPQRQPHALPPASTVTHTVHTPRGNFRACAGDDVRLKWTVRCAARGWASAVRAAYQASAEWHWPPHKPDAPPSGSSARYTNLNKDFHGHRPRHACTAAPGRRVVQGRAATGALTPHWRPDNLP